MYDKENIFAKIIAGTVPSNKIYEDEKILAFHDIFPKAEVHVLVIPKGEYIDFEDFISKASPEDKIHFFNKVAEITKGLDLEEGYRLVTNKGVNGGQEVPHFHMHILGGKKLGGIAG
jgi:diadenosine tetraphosphate (Ap4A) HIT family hydrolase